MNNNNVPRRHTHKKIVPIRQKDRIQNVFAMSPQKMYLYTHTHLMGSKYVKF